MGADCGSEGAIVLAFGCQLSAVSLGLGVRTDLLGPTGSPDATHPHFRLFLDILINCFLRTDG